jgi:hypothetical protein
MLSSSPLKIHEPRVTGVSPRPTGRRQRQKTAKHEGGRGKLPPATRQARSLENLGWTYADLDDQEEARRVWTDAAALYATAGAEDDAKRVRQAITDLDRKRRHWWRR